MGDYNSMYQSICRLCLSQNTGEKMVSLFEDRADDGLSCFGKAISIVTNILLQKDDNLPYMMCKKCAYLLKRAIAFKIKCETTNSKLQSLLESDANSDFSDRSIKEKVCDYVMYSQYFPSYANQTNISSKNLNKNGLKHDNTKSTISQIEIEIMEIESNTSDQGRTSNGFLSNSDNVKDHDSNLDDNSGSDNVLDSIKNIINTNDNKLCNKTDTESLHKVSDCLPVSTNKKNLICKICNKKLATYKSYTQHVKRHNTSCFICDQCGMGFAVEPDLHMHLQIKHGIGHGLECDRCSYKARRKIDLVEHIRLHTGERPFSCENCGLTFRRKAIYKKHLTYHMEKIVPCTHCPMKFYEKSHMLAHCNSAHERIYMFMCSICNVTYARIKTVRQHMTAKHGIAREKQGKVIRISHKDVNTNKAN